MARWTWWVALAMWLATVACSGPTPCIAGSSVSCVCPGGAPGAQTCFPDGSRFGTCQCGTTATDSGTVVPPDGGTQADVGAITTPDAGPPLDVGPSCPSPQVLCRSLCTDTQSNPTNCGACGMGCNAGYSCTNGVCVSGCSAPRMLCGPTCVDTTADSANCGSCGNACPGGQACSGGACTCLAGRTLCGGRCVDSQTDASNCGRCGTTCPSGICAGGVCTAVAVCSIGEGATCSPGNPAPACCAAGRLCADNGLGGNACCRNAGGAGDSTVPRGAGCCGTASCVGGTCVLPATCAGAGTPCGTGCCTGLTCSGGTCIAPSGLHVTAWNFELYNAGAAGYLFPSYIAHLIANVGHVTSPLITAFACATITNGGTTPQTATVTVRFGSFFMMDAVSSATINPGQTTPVCPLVSFNFAAFHSLTINTPAVIAAGARDSSGADIGSTNRAVTVMPSSSILPVTGSTAHTWDDLLAVTSEPPQVRTLLPSVAAASQFTGAGVFSGYSRPSFVRPAVGIAASSWFYDVLWLDAGESVSFGFNAISGGPLNAYVFTPTQYTAWAAGTSVAASAVWVNQMTGSGQSFTATVGGSYFFVMHNVATDGSSRGVVWTRGNTRQDVATDALQAIYTVLQGRGFRYSNIPSDYFGSLGQHVRLPSEALAGGALAGANCIDGTILFASVLELAGMEPVMIVVNRPVGGGHAYIGVKARPANYDPHNAAMFAAPATVWVIETTMMGTDTASAARYAASMERFTDSTNYTAGMAGSDYYEVDIATMRTRGITPIP